MIHELAEVHTDNIGKGTSIWQYSIILKNATIGDNCNVNCHVFIENDVVIKNNVTTKEFRFKYIVRGIGILINKK